MIRRLTAFILLITASLFHTSEVPEQLSLTVVELGHSVTLSCPASDGKFFYWYKQSVGYLAQTIVSEAHGSITTSEQFKNSRFAVTKNGSQSFLTIRNVSKEDEATYFCQTGATYSQNFLNGTFLSVIDRNQQKSVSVKQTPETASAPPGGSVNLQCSLVSKNKGVQCPGEHRAYWFRAGSGGPHPGVIYTHGNCNDEEEERSCLYSLSKTIQNSSDDGTYYCAVVTCAGILIGEGTKVETRPDLDPVLIVLGVLLACCVTVIGFLIVYINRRKVCEHCKGEGYVSRHVGHDTSTVDQSDDLDGEAKAGLYAALDFSTRKLKTGSKSQDLPQDCVYSAVRADNGNLQHPCL